MADAKRDGNHIPTLLAVSSADGSTPVVLYADPVTHRLYCDLTAGGTTTVDVDPTTITLGSLASADVTNTGDTTNAVFQFSIPKGSTMYSTVLIPNNAIGEDGDWAFSTAITAEVFYKSGGAWALVNSIRGATGATGAIGATGPVGLTWKGTYGAGTSYVVNDGVALNGTSYICIQNGTGQTPDPAGTAYWSVLALKGTDGAGSGDVLGPATNTADYIPQWNGSNSKTLKNGIDPVTLLTTSTGLKLDQSTPQTIQGRPILDDGLQLGLTPTIGATEIGKLYWDVDWKTPICELEDDVRLQIGQEEMAYVYNGTGSTIGEGKVVYVSGTQAGVQSISLAQGDIDATSKVLGVVTSTSIPTGEYGYVTRFGNVNDIDTSAWSLNDELYLDSTTAGAFTNVKPNTGDYDTRVGRVMLVNATTGRVFVNVIREYKTGVISGGAGVDFFLDDTSIIATSADNTYPVNTLTKVPVTSTEEVDSISVTAATSPVLYGEYLFNTGLGDTTIQGGVWTFDIYAGVSSATNTSSITQNIYRARPEAGTVTIDNVVGTSARATASTGTPFAITKIDPSAVLTDCSYLMIDNNTKGLYPITARTSDTVVTITVPAGYTPAAASTFQVQKKLFGISTGEINNVATAPLYAGLQLYTVTTVQPAYTILSTDELGTKMFGVSNGTRVLYFSHNGTTRYSHFTSPLITRHNDLAGLQGGAAGEYYHLTSAQATVVGNTSGTNTGDNSANTNAGLVHTAGAESITGAKTFDKDTILMKGTSTGTTTVSTAQTDASTYTQTMQARNGTIANLDNVTYIGTTSVALNRTSAALTLAGITLTTPDIGTPSAGTLTSCTGLPIAGLVASTSTALGVGSIELGHASDTTLARVSAGVVSIENSNIMTVGSADTVTGVKTLGTTGALKLGSAVTDKCEIRLNDSALNDETWSGTVIDAVAGATIAVGDVCYLKTADGQWYLNDGILDGTDTGFKLKLGICVLAANDNGATKMLLDGVIASAAFPAFTIGAPVYLDDTAGDLVVAQPSTTNFAIRVVGEAVSATVLHFHPSNDYIVKV